MKYVFGFMRLVRRFALVKAYAVPLRKIQYM